MVRNVLKKLIEEIGISINETPIILDITSAINKTIKPEDQVNPEKETKVSSNFILLLHWIFINFNTD